MRTDDGHIMVNGVPLKEAVDQQLRTEIEEVRIENIRDVSRRTQIISPLKLGTGTKRGPYATKERLAQQTAAVRKIVERHPAGIDFVKILADPEIDLTKPQLSVVLRRAGCTTELRGPSKGALVRLLRPGEQVRKNARRKAAAEPSVVITKVPPVPKLLVGSIRSELLEFAKAMHSVERLRVGLYSKLSRLAITESQNWDSMVQRLVAGKHLEVKEGN